MKTKQAFAVNFIFFATVPPYDPIKKYRNRHLKYKLVNEPGKSTDFLFKIFDSAKTDCKIEITFVSTNNQENDVRDLLLEIATITNITEKERIAKKLARRMYDITDDRNGAGLFVIIEGKKDKKTRLMLCRFKGVEALHTDGKALEYLAEVFSKQSNHYKLVVYEDPVSSKSFWKGYAIDKQTSPNSYKPFSNFWIERFLQSQTSITSAQGTMQFSKIVKILLNKTKDLGEAEQVISAIVNLKSKHNAQLSIKSFCENYLSPVLQDAVKAEVNDDFYYSTFSIDDEVFKKELGSTVLSMKDGIMAFVPTFKYNEHVTEEIDKNGTKKVTIEGILQGKKINSGKKADSPPPKKKQLNAKRS